MAMGVLRWEHCITHRIGAVEAPAMYARINGSEHADIVGVVINWLD